jgi:hypothetical protein
MPVTINHSGTSEECMNHLLHGYDRLETTTFTADFVGVEAQTVRRWYREGREPTGMGRIRLRVMLHLLGYKVKEYDSLPDFNKQLAQMLVFDVVSIQKIMKITGHGDDEAIMRLVREGGNMETDRMFRVQQELRDKKYVEPLELKRGLAEMRVDKFLRGLESVTGSVNDDSQPAPAAPAVSPSVMSSPAPANSGSVVSVTPSEDDMAYALVDMFKAVVTLGKILEGSPSWKTQRHYVRLMLEQHGTADSVNQFLDRLGSS